MISFFHTVAPTWWYWPWPRSRWWCLLLPLLKATGLAFLSWECVNVLLPYNCEQTPLLDTLDLLKCLWAAFTTWSDSLPLWAGTTFTGRLLRYIKRGANVPINFRRWSSPTLLKIGFPRRLRILKEPQLAPIWLIDFVEASLLECRSSTSNSSSLWRPSTSIILFPPK